jgi:predicted secreted protein
MAYHVQGSGIIIEAVKDAAYRRFACAQAITLTVETDVLETSTPETGAWKTFKPVGQNSWRVSLQGILFLRDQSTTKNFALETITEQIRSDGYDIRLRFIDVEGYQNILSGSVYIPFTEITGGAINPFGKFSTEWLGSGAFTLDISTEPINDDVFTYRYSGTGGETSVTDASLIGVTPLLGFKGTDEYKVITSGTPGQQEIKHDASTGELSWLIELNAPVDGVPERITFTYKS